MIGGTGRNKEIFRIKKGPEANQLNDSSLRFVPGGVGEDHRSASSKLASADCGLLGVPSPPTS